MITWMGGKLLSLLTTAKGAAAATVIVGAAVGGGVVATNPDVQNAIGSAVSGAVETVTGAPAEKAAPSGEPAVVTARNTADKDLRDAFQADQQRLEKLRSTRVESSDRGKLEDIVKNADAQLRERLTKALNDVAALTLGREGLEASGSPRPTGTGRPSASPDVKATFTADAQAKVREIVKAAIAAMDKIVADADKAVALLPTASPGRPSDVPGGRPSAAPAGAPGGAGGGPPGGAPGGPAGGAGGSPGVQPSGAPGPGGGQVAPGGQSGPGGAPAGPGGEGSGPRTPPVSPSGRP